MRKSVTILTFIFKLVIVRAGFIYSNNLLSQKEGSDRSIANMEDKSSYKPGLFCVLLHVGVCKWSFILNGRFGVGYGLKSRYGHADIHGFIYTLGGEIGLLGVLRELPPLHIGGVVFVQFYDNITKVDTNREEEQGDIESDLTGLIVGTGIRLRSWIRYLNADLTVSYVIDCFKLLNGIKIEGSFSFVGQLGLYISYMSLFGREYYLVGIEIGVSVGPLGAIILEMINEKIKKEKDEED